MALAFKQQMNRNPIWVAPGKKLNRKPVLRTERLQLRRWQESDHLPYIEMNRDHETMAYYPTILEPMQVLSCIEASERNFDQYGFSFWAVEHRDTREFVGCVGLDMYTLPNGQETVAISWQLARKFWDLGYGQESAQAVIDYGFETLDIPEIVAVAPEVNGRSVRLARKLGFSRDLWHNIEEPAWPQGHPCRQQSLYRITRQHLRRN